MEDREIDDDHDDDDHDDDDEKNYFETLLRLDLAIVVE